MKILYLHNAKYTSEMANLIQVKSVCKAMANLNNEVILALQGNDKTSKLIKENGFMIYIRENLLNNKFDKYFNFFSIRKVLKNYNSDLIYLRSPLLLKQVIFSRKPIIIELHNSKLHLGYTWLNNYWTNFLVNESKKQQIKKVVCISKALADYWIEKGIPKEKVIVAHDAIDCNDFSKLIDRIEARALLNLPIDKKIVTYTGRLYGNRRPENVINLAKIYTEAQFLVVGGPDSESNKLNIHAKDKHLDNIQFTGQVEHSKIPLYLYASDILLGLWSSDVPTMNYCSPLKVFEYMAAERIIVAHGFPTIKEVLTDYENALLVEPDSFDDLSNKVGIALKIDYPSEIAKKARNDVFEKYTWEKRTRMILSDFL